MTENSITDVRLSIKGEIKAIRRRFLAKMKAVHRTHVDPQKPQCKTNFDSFIPRIDPGHLKPCVLFNMANGKGKCQARFSDPLSLADLLDEISKTLRSDEWLDAWEEMNECADKLMVNNELVFNEEVFDMNAWKRSIITDEIQMATTTNKFDRKTQESLK